MLEVAGSIAAEGMFSETFSPAWTFQCEDMDIQLSPEIGKPIGATIKGVWLSCVSIKSEHVEYLTIKMAMSTMVIRHRSDNASSI